MAFSLLSPSSSTAAPFCLGFAFRPGDIPAGQAATTSAPNVQITPTNFWNDGSLKFAVIAGLAPLAANQALTVSLAAGAAAGGTALTLADLKATGVIASFGCGNLGSVTWAAGDWDAPLRQWVSGPQMSSWIYSKPVGSDAHLVAWLEVRLFFGGAVEVLPWIENGYLRVAGPANKSATYTFTLGATQRFSGLIDLPHHCRTPLVSGSALSHWLGADPLVTVRHDVAYLQATELVPTYFGVVPASASRLAVQPASYAPLQQGSFSYSGDNMAGTGYQEPIGLLPEHDVLYLTANDSPQVVYDSVVRNGYSAGRYPIHYRDETTNRPLQFSAYPHLVIADGSAFKDNGSSDSNQFTPAVSGTVPKLWDVAHSPAVGYMAYLVTGRWYFMEECQFAATVAYLGRSDNANNRDGSKGLVQTVIQGWQTRSCAWQLRTLVHALTVTPDADAGLRNEFIASVQSNIDHFFNRYVAQPNNPLGFIRPGETEIDNNIAWGDVWQQDFVTAVFGYALALDLPVSTAHASRLASFFAWKAKSIVGRLGTSSDPDWWYINGFASLLFFSPPVTLIPDYVTGTGPWYSTWRQAYNDLAATKPAWFGSTEGVLTDATSIDDAARAKIGNAMPALAYAVRHKVAGADAAYGRVVSATNWPMVAAEFNTYPVWSVAPARHP